MVAKHGTKEDVEVMRRLLNGSLAALAFIYLAGIGTVAMAQNPGGSAEGRAMKNPVASNAASIAAGKTAFDRYCKFCHGADAKGNGPMAPKGTHPSDLTDSTWDRGGTDGEIFLVIQDGAGPKFDMKGFKGKMTDEQMWSIVNYLRSLHH
jgi:mono/diheme cytochrome c family protein